ncbi:995_t:CDS:2 [Dentiscutata heterogama]|uniref:995_t:CDS:1 n=1 Tax=Dentiscutata heterogama TaxID=1316150 RepID=A0ACA9K1U5_9GLOM|nr:995_t:CDS:2 [Dentiscutata heterogama]
MNITRKLSPETKSSMNKVNKERTGISIETVKVSNRNPQVTCKFSESTQLPNVTETGEPARATSYKQRSAPAVLTTIAKQLIKWEPDDPTFLPSTPDAMEARRGNAIMARKEEEKTLRVSNTRAPSNALDPVLDIY